MDVSLEFVTLFIVALLIAGAPFWFAIWAAGTRGKQAVLGVWIAETLLLFALLWRHGFVAWTNPESFNEPGEWMTIQGIQSLAICVWGVACGYAVIKLMALNR